MQLVAAFMGYLQINNQQQNNPYPTTWLEKQANEFHSTVLYAEQQVAFVIGNTEESVDSISHFIQDIHRNCSKEAYKIKANAKNGDGTEKPGYFRHTEAFSIKTIPILNSENPEDLHFLRLGKMPKVLDGRLQQMKINPELLSRTQKEHAINGQSAWLSANDVIQITAYIQAHFNLKESYYFLRAYYKEHYLLIDRTDDPKAMVMANYLKSEIHVIGKTLGLKFKETTRLSTEEKVAYNRVYITYPQPNEIITLFAQYVHNISQEIRDISPKNTEKIADLSFKIINDYMKVHPFLDANYRTISIMVNALLSHWGYEFISFHDNTLKRQLNIAFNHSEPDEKLAIATLKYALVRKEKTHEKPFSSVKLSENSALFKQCKDTEAESGLSSNCSLKL